MEFVRAASAPVCQGSPVTAPDRLLDALLRFNRGEPEADGTVGNPGFAPARPGPTDRRMARHGDPNRREGGLSERFDIRCDPATRQRFGVLTISPIGARSPSQRPGHITLFLPPWNCSVRDPTTLLRAREIARQTQTTVIAVNLPGLDGSSGLTRPQRSAFRTGTGLQEVGSAVLRMLAASGVTSADVAAVSLGARAGAGVLASAAHSPLVIERAVLVDPAGAAVMSVRELMHRFFADGRLLEAAQRFPHDSAFIAAAGLDHSALSRKVDYFSRVLRPLLTWGGAHAYYATYLRAMCAGTLGHDIQQGLRSDTLMQVTLVHGGRSRIAPSREIDALLDAVAAPLRARLHLERHPAASHAGFDHPAILGPIVQRALILGRGREARTL